MPALVAGIHVLEWERLTFSGVMRGLDPRIPIIRAQCPTKRDGRDKPGHDAANNFPRRRAVPSRYRAYAPVPDRAARPALRAPHATPESRLPDAARPPP